MSLITLSNRFVIMSSTSLKMPSCRTTQDMIVFLPFPHHSHLEVTIWLGKMSEFDWQALYTHSQPTSGQPVMTWSGLSYPESGQLQVQQQSQPESNLVAHDYGMFVASFWQWPWSWVTSLCLSSCRRIYQYWYQFWWLHEHRWLSIGAADSVAWSRFPTLCLRKHCANSRVAVAQHYHQLQQ